jgi:hypothetical protein
MEIKCFIILNSDIHQGEVLFWNLLLKRIRARNLSTVKQVSSK